MIVNLLFASALYFYTGVEAIQTLIHSDHTDYMHQPEVICILAGIGLVLNVACILLIGGEYIPHFTHIIINDFESRSKIDLGYTHHQGSFLALTPRGDVFIQNQAASEEAVRLGLRRLATTTERSSDCTAIQQFSIEETENSLDDKTKDVRMSQKWPTLGSVFRDVSSNSQFPNPTFD